jgi:hypothetical protein
MESRDADNGCRAQNFPPFVYDNQRAWMVRTSVMPLLLSSSSVPTLIQSSGRGVERRLLPGSDMEALGLLAAVACPDLAGQKPGRQSARHCVLLGVLPLGRRREMPTLVAVFEPTRTTVPLQRDTEMVGSNRHPKLP